MSGRWVTVTAQVWVGSLEQGEDAVKRMVAGLRESGAPGPGDHIITDNPYENEWWARG